MDIEEPPASKSSLERVLHKMDITVKKHPEPILTPDNFDWNTSIRNPAAFTYNGRIGLLCTVRHTKDNKSRLHLAWSENGTNFDLEKEPFIDTNPDSLLGVEDARITKISNEYLITFTNFKETDKKTYNTTRIGLAKTRDFKEHYDRQIILDEFGNNKNCVIFKGDNENYYTFHRPFNEDRHSKSPSAMMSITKNFRDFNHLKTPFLSPRGNGWESARVGINTPLIEIYHPRYGKSLFQLYHGASKEKNIYSMGYIVLDGKDPTKILERSTTPLIRPELDHETGKGKYDAEVPNVVFGCGAIPIGENIIKLYYAGADRHISFVDITFNDAKIKDYSVN